MVNTTKSAEELRKKFGPNGEKIAELVETLSACQWFEHVGSSERRKEAEQALEEWKTKEKTAHLKTVWMTKEEFAELYVNHSLSENPFWRLLLESYQQAKRNGERYVANAADQVTDAVFHQAYDAAYRQWNEIEMEAVKNAASLAVVIALACLATEALGDGSERRFAPLLEVLLTGHLPAGIGDGNFYLI